MALRRQRVHPIASRQGLALRVCQGEGGHRNLDLSGERVATANCAGRIVLPMDSYHLCCVTNGRTCAHLYGQALSPRSHGGLQGRKLGASVVASQLSKRGQLTQPDQRSQVALWLGSVGSGLSADSDEPIGSGGAAGSAEPIG